MSNVSRWIFVEAEDLKQLVSFWGETNEAVIVSQFFYSQQERKGESLGSLRDGTAKENREEENIICILVFC